MLGRSAGRQQTRDFVKKESALRPPSRVVVVVVL